MHKFFVLSLLSSLAALHAADGNSTTIVIDGSSTVYPITVAIGERYAAQNTSATIEVLCSRSTAGFRRLVAGEVPISGASRPIKPDELSKAAKAGIDVIELPVAIDGLSVVVNKRNSFVDSLSVAELKKIWEPDSAIKNWRQVRPSFPDIPIVLFGPGKDSGTFDYFTEVIVGTARSSRSDYTSSEDDNVLVQGIEKNIGALGYFGMSYLRENEALLKAVAIDSGNGAVLPTSETVLNGTYRPLSRPLFLYANKAAVRRTEVRQFLEAYLKMVPSFAPQVGYVPFEPEIYELVSQRLASLTAGSIFVGARAGALLAELLAGNSQRTVVVPLTLSSTTPPALPDHAQKKTVIPTAPPLTNNAAPISAPPFQKPNESPAAAVGMMTPGNTTISPSSANSAARLEKESLKTLDYQRLDLLRDRAIAMARLTLDESASLEDISARVEELRLLTVSMRKTNKLPEQLIPEDHVGFTALIERLQLTNEGRSVMTEDAFAQLKTAMVAITDPSLQRKLALAFLRSSPEQLPAFTSAISAANGGRADIDAILCYARGGFIIR